MACPKVSRFICITNTIKISNCTSANLMRSSSHSFIIHVGSTSGERWLCFSSEKSTLSSGNYDTRRVAWKWVKGLDLEISIVICVCLLSQICSNVSAHAALSLYFLLVYDCTPQRFEALWWDATLLRRCWNLWAKHIRWTGESVVLTQKFLLTQRQRRHRSCFYNCLICSSSRDKRRQ